MSSTPSTISDIICNDSLWYIYLLSSVMVLLLGVAIVLLLRCFMQVIEFYWKCKRSSFQNRKPQMEGCSPSMPSTPSSPTFSLTATQTNYNETANKAQAAKVINLPSSSVLYNTFTTTIKDWALAVLSEQKSIGRVIVILSFLLSMFSLLLYIYDTHRYRNIGSGVCHEWRWSPVYQADLIINIFFLIYFILRMMASNDKFLYFFDLHSLVDIFIIPPMILSFHYNRFHLGFRFTRALRVMNLTDVLQYLNILKSNRNMRLCNLLTLFAALVTTTAGFIHLCENAGDPPKFLNHQNLSYFDCIYFMIVTFSTVGYGDISCHTMLARLAMILFILIGLAALTNSIPEIVKILDARNQYSGNYNQELYKRHLLLCGHITVDSVRNFLADFLHEDRAQQDIKIVVLGNNKPSLELQNLIKRYFANIVFLQGNVMKTKDLKRTAIESADACLVLANKYCMDPDAEDAANIMRVISIKNFCNKIRIIIQLMQYHNKAYLMNIPSWNWKNGDDAVCLAELKLGFLAQSCLAPGFSTLLANLFVMRSFVKQTNRPKWLNEYMKGAGMEIYVEYFSEAFHGLCFSDAASLCFQKLNILLIAVKLENCRNPIIAINPKNTTIINATTKGFFIAQSSEEVKKVLEYCDSCHSQITTPLQISRCQCRNTAYSGNVARDVLCDSMVSIQMKRSFQCIKNDDAFQRQSSQDDEMPLQAKDDQQQQQQQTQFVYQDTIALDELPIQPQESVSLAAVPSAAGGGGGLHLGKHFFDTALFPSKTTSASRQPAPDVTTRTTLISAAGQIRASATLTQAYRLNHQTEPKFDYIGMYHWCHERSIDEAILSPDTVTSTVFCEHIVACVFADDGSPLIGLRNFVMPLRASNFHYNELKHIIFLGNLEYFTKEWKSICNFPKLSLMPGSPLSRSHLRAVNINLCDMCVILSSNQNFTLDDPALVDKEAIVCSLNIQAMQFDNIPSSLLVDFEGRSSHLIDLEGIRRTGQNIPTITELAVDDNVQFLDQHDEDDPDVLLFMTQPFACGTVFTVSVLDSLMSTAFYNGDALLLIRNLITGGATPELELMLAEGAGIKGALVTETTLSNRERARVGQLTVGEGILERFTGSHTFGDLFLDALKQCNILCIALYRGMHCGRVHTEIPKRYVVTNPPANFPLRIGDKVCCLKPFAYSTETPM